ncbi:MAG: SDR family oxidoreductase [Myxococcota bacterium]|nr:SDR family oxidoreductase [Myxococcota bacterium]
MSPAAGILAGGAVVITGAGSGIGQATARVCAREGAALVVGDLDAARAAETAQGIARAGGRAVPIAGDVADSATHAALAEACLAEFGTLSGWVNNAAFAGGSALVDTDDEAWQRVQAVTLGGTFQGCRRAIAAMPGGGAIVNIASGAGLGAEPGLSAYGAAKAGVIALTRSAAVEYAAQGVRVNCLAPGPIDTPGLAGWVDAFPGGRAGFEAQIPQRRLGRPEEMAETIAFLLSSRASYINGAVLVADGGIHARLASPRPDPS